MSVGAAPGDGSVLVETRVELAPDELVNRSSRRQVCRRDLHDQVTVGVADQHRRKALAVRSDGDHHVEHALRRGQDQGRSRGAMPGLELAEDEHESHADHDREDEVDDPREHSHLCLLFWTADTDRLDLFF